jgi:hypothetical protein
MRLDNVLPTIDTILSLMVKTQLEGLLNCDGLKSTALHAYSTWDGPGGWTHPGTGQVTRGSVPLPLFSLRACVCVSPPPRCSPLHTTLALPPPSLTLALQISRPRRHLCVPPPPRPLPAAEESPFAENLEAVVS